MQYIVFFDKNRLNVYFCNVIMFLFAIDTKMYLCYNNTRKLMLFFNIFKIGGKVL